MKHTENSGLLNFVFVLFLQWKAEKSSEIEYLETHVNDTRAFTRKKIEK